MTTELDRIVEVAKCPVTEAMCHCDLVFGHAGPHECDCGGSWTFDENGRFVPVAFPAGTEDFLADLLGGF